MKLGGGTKYTLALVIVMVFLFVLVWLAVTGRLEAMLAGILVGGVTGIKGIFDAANTANNRAALAAGKAKEDEAKALAGLAPPGVLDRAGGITGTDVSGAVDAEIAAGRARLADRARAILEGAGTGAPPGGGPGDRGDGHTGGG